MTLSALIQKGGLAKIATATLATTATIAEKTRPPEESATATSATMATQVTESEGTVAGVATVAVAYSEKPPVHSQERGPAATLSKSEESTIHIWLAHIGETDPQEIADVLDVCRANTEARVYFLRRAVHSHGEI